MSKIILLPQNKIPKTPFIKYRSLFMVFHGREEEKKLLDNLWHQKKLKLVVLKGRRRVGKSSLIKEYSKNYSFIEFMGILSDTKRVNQPKEEEKKQLENLQMNFIKYFGRNPKFTNWASFFYELELEINKIDKKTILFFDEISWMGQYSSNFMGQLKNFIDNIMSNSNIMMVLCGSISIWIENNIIKSRAFTGRIDCTIILNELPLHEANLFFPKNISTKEKLKILMITGGIPKYLEAFNFNNSFESNIELLAFNQTGLLFNDFHSIFYDSLSTNSEKFLKIVEFLATGKKTYSDINLFLTKEYKLENKSTQLPSLLDELVLAGFISKDVFCNLRGKPSKSSFYRLKDNYIRFFLKVIKPNIDTINKERKMNFRSAYENFASIQGLQFENLVYNNYPLICEFAHIKEIKSIGPYSQKGNSENKGLQVDLLIQDSFDNLFLFEVKFKDKIKNNIIDEIEEKVVRLKKPKRMSVRKYLVYSGELAEEVKSETIRLNGLLNFETLLS